MMKNLRLVLRNIKVYPLVKYAVVTYSFLCILLIGLFVWQYKDVHKLVEQSNQVNKNYIESLITINDQTKKSYNVKTDKIVKLIEQHQKYEYEQFLEKYFENQSYYLNFWLTILSIFIGIFAIIIPICFIKFFDEKRKEIDKAIKDCHKQRKQTYVNLGKMQKQLNQVGDLAKKVKVSSVHIADQVNEVKANSMLTELHFCSGLKKDNKIMDIINSSINIKKTKENLSTRAYIFGIKKDYENAIKDLEECLRLFGKDDGTLSELGAYYLDDKKYVKAKEYLLEAINLNNQSFFSYYNLTECYIMLEDIPNALITLNQILFSEPNPYIYDDDKQKWIIKIKSLKQNNQTISLLKSISNLEVKFR